MTPKSLVCGVGGQTGGYLAQELLSTGHTVIGTSRGSQETCDGRLRRLGIATDIDHATLNPSSTREIKKLLTEHEPDFIFVLTGPSSVGQSFFDPLGTVRSIYSPLEAMLNVLRETGSSIRLINASSTDCFGHQPKSLLDESSRFQPISPYGVAKATTFWATRNARTGYGLNASNAILSNHESPLRGADFVTHKIVSVLKDISQGKAEKLVLGNMSISRDWLWAGDVARALALIAESPDPDDYLVASGQSHTLLELVQGVCERLGLVFEDVVVSDQSLYRPTEIPSIQLNPAKIRRDLGWEPHVDFESLIDSLVSGDLL